MNTWICIFFLGVALSAPADEFRSLIYEGDLSINDESYRMQIIPAGFTPHNIRIHSKVKLTDFISQENENYVVFNNFIEKGYATKGITFNIYDTNIRETTIALFRVLQDLNSNEIKLVQEWAKQNINEDILDYALKLTALYSNDVQLAEMSPPFITKPNFFINSETLVKALRLKLNYGHIHPQEAEIYQIRKIDDKTFTINTNYSGWDHPNECDQDTNYFREDISLNSYYYGLHLLHPFWMSNEELDEMNPRHAEHYLFALKQLLSRYNLEKQHLLQGDKSLNEDCDIDYRPFLMYDNGLAFPNRPSFISSHEISNEKFVTIDIAIKECLSRRIIMMSNGTLVKIDEDNYLQLLPKLLRANLDGVKSGETIRNLFGYGVGTQNVSTPSPSIMHQYQTALRDRVYWVLLERALNYSLDFLKDMGPFDLSAYETDSFRIIDSQIDDFVSFFDYYQFNINKALIGSEKVYVFAPNPHMITARQMRLKHVPFKVSFNVESDMEQDVVVRLFLGPQCYNSTCWDNYHKFFEMDAFKCGLKQGFTNITWSPDNSSRFSFDDFFNLEAPVKSAYKYNMYKFPANLLIPRGLEDGLHLTMFVMITPVNTFEMKTPEANLYKNITMSLEIDDKPLGFPFHRLATNYKDNASNYGFYNVSVYHHKRTVNGFGQFSMHLY
ncbi:arylphorin subunit alpha [Amyelois transitella]|uniref:arylphorin subunit alpha n=1 Tax=Amyelois transitella TaxID=680683 RepID=UPI00298F8162|nr:arylphorin subunit alpha [Amyelois transitella]